MKIESVETAYYRLPLEPMGDAGHGAIDTEELITLALRAEGLTGNGYTYTIGRGGRAIKALIDHDLAPLIEGEDADDIEGLWDLMWRRLLYVGRRIGPRPTIQRKGDPHEDRERRDRLLPTAAGADG